VVPEAADDLTAIKGLGKVKAAKLVAAGVTSYAQVAAWTDEDIAEMGLVSNTSPGQIKREDWVGQARALAED
jgi:large subunit ribosomal protein L21